jgi:hypothetical protein
MTVLKLLSFFISENTAIYCAEFDSSMVKGGKLRNQRITICFEKSIYNPIGAMRRTAVQSFSSGVTPVDASQNIRAQIAMSAIPISFRTTTFQRRWFLVSDFLA